MIEKILIKILGLLLIGVSIILIVKLILIGDYYEDLIILASYVFLITIIIITLILGIAFLMAKVSKKTIIHIIEDDRDDEKENRRFNFKENKTVL